MFKTMIFIVLGLGLMTLGCDEESSDGDSNSIRDDEKQDTKSSDDLPAGDTKVVLDNGDLGDDPGEDTTLDNGDLEDDPGEDTTEVDQGDTWIPFGELAIDYDAILPPDGVIVAPEYSPFGVSIPAPKFYNGFSDFQMEITIEASSTGFKDGVRTIASQVASPGDLVTGSVDLNGLSEGDQIKFLFMIHPIEFQEETGLERTVTYSNIKNPVRVTDCLVVSAHVGSPLEVQCNALAPGGPDSLAEGWSYSGGPKAGTIQNGILVTAEALEDIDIGFYDLQISVADDKRKSEPYIFSVPVDEHITYLTFEMHSPGDPPEQVLFRKVLPEKVADSIASGCGAAFDPSLKPATEGDKTLSIPVDLACAAGVLSGLDVREMRSLAHLPFWYNNSPYEKYNHRLVEFMERSEKAEIVYSRTPIVEK